jgi:hypothetical protein
VPPLPLACERPAQEEAGEVVRAAEPGGQRRHRPRRLLPEHRDDGGDVAALHGVHVALDHDPHLLVAERAQVRLLGALRQLGLHGRAGALERAVDRGDGGLEHLGDLPRRVAEHLAQEQHGALGGGQVLDGGDEGELDALALLVARVGCRKAVAEPHRLVRVGLDPHRLGERQADPLRPAQRRHRVQRQHALRRAAGDLVQAGVRRDRVKP